jgi:triphosphatase
MFLEIELKLAIVPSALENLYLLFEHPTLLDPTTIGPTGPQYLVSTYFDTPDRCLWQQGLSLRIRQDQERFIQTIKTSGTKQDQLHYRYEWEETIIDTQPDIRKFKDPQLNQQLNKIIGDKKLVELFKTQINRTQWEIFRENTKVELVLDQGYIATQSEKEALNELELELKFGSEQVLHELANELCRSVPLLPELRSKAERGYKLAKLQPIFP